MSPKSAIQLIILIIIFIIIGGVYFKYFSKEKITVDQTPQQTEKEINTITYLSKSNKPVSIDELQEKVWSYQSDMETHTVETHIYRLRKKILDKFDDRELIISEKDGYQIK